MLNMSIIHAVRSQIPEAHVPIVLKMLIVHAIRGQIVKVRCKKLERKHSDNVENVDNPQSIKAKLYFNTLYCKSIV